jgi:hypothetical protein
LGNDACWTAEKKINDEGRKEKGISWLRALNGHGEVASSFTALPTRSAVRPGARKHGEDTTATVRREKEKRKTLVTIARFSPF